MAKEEKKEVGILTDAPGTSRYYESLGLAFRYARFIVLFILVAFLIINLSVFRDDISVRNFQYVLKYITTDDDSLITTKKIHYPTSDSKALELFGGDLVSAGNGGITLYDTNGSTVLELSDVYSDPVFEITPKYALCYDLGGNSYVIFSTFSKLFSDKTEFPISDASMEKNGDYAILTKSREYRSVINIYDSDSTLVSRISKDKYVFAIALSNRKLAAASLSANDSRYFTSLTVTKVGTDSETVVAEIFDEYPIAVEFSGDKLIFVTDSAIRFYDGEFNPTGEYRFGSNILGSVDITDEYVMLTLGKNIIGSDNTVKFYSNTGTYMFGFDRSGSDGGKIVSTAASVGTAVIAFDDKLIEIDTETRDAKLCHIDSGADKILLQADSSVLVCYRNHAVLCDFSQPYDSFHIGADSDRTD